MEKIISEIRQPGKVVNSPPFRQTLACLFGAALLLYLVYLPRFFVGAFFDDAIFVLAAKSLLQGHYNSLFEPGNPPINQFLPGYPLFLIPWVLGAAPHWSWLKVSSIGLTLLSGWLFWRLWRHQPGRAPLLLLGLFLFNPVIALHSGSVLSDVCFGMATLLVFVVLRAYVERPAAVGMWALALVLAWAALLRPVGALIFPAVFLGLVSNKKTKEAWLPVGLASIPWAAFYLRTYLLTHAANGYITQWQGELPALLQQPALMALNAIEVVRSFFAEGLLGIPGTTSSLLAALLASGLGVGCIVVIVKGYRVLLAQKDLPKEVLVAMGVWGVLYLAVHAGWTARQIRHVIPLIPVVLPFLWAGAASYGNKRRGSQALAAAVCISLGLCYTVSHAQFISQTWSSQRPIESRLPQQTFAWINAHLPADAQFITKGPVTYLYTQRRGITALGVIDLEEFRYQLQKRDIGYLMAQPYHIVEVIDPNFSIQDMWDRNMGWAAAWPAYFPLIYQNEKEGTRIYQVRKDPLFVQAFDLLNTAQQSFADGKLDEALSQIQRADRLSPGSVQILNAMGGIWLEKGRIPEAEKTYLHALKIRPNHPLTNLGLAELYRRMGQITKARIYLQLCEKVLEGSPELHRYAQVIAIEKSRLER